MPPKRKTPSAKQTAAKADAVPKATKAAKATKPTPSEDGNGARVEPRRGRSKFVLDAPALPAVAPKAKRRGGKKAAAKEKAPAASTSTDTVNVELDRDEADVSKRKQAKRAAKEPQLNEVTVVSDTSNE